MNIQVSELIVRFLENLGIDTIFGMPGAHILPVYDHLYHSKIKSVLAKHEQGAAFMAGGYARATGGIGACIATAGPGASNLVTGIANAYADKQPVIAITGEAPTHIFGRGGLQESSGEGGSVDQTALFSGVTRYHKLIERTDYLANVLNQAARQLLAESPGPVVLSIPFNVQTETVDASILDQLANFTHPPKRHISHCDVDESVEFIHQARHPVLVAGFGCLRSKDAREALTNLSQNLNIPVTTSLKGKGAIDERSPLSLGSLGVTSSGYALQYIKEKADLIILLGAGFNERTSYVWNTDLTVDRKIIQVDQNAQQLEKVLKADLAIQSDLKVYLQALDKACQSRAIAAKSLPDLNGFRKQIDDQAKAASMEIFDDKFDLIKAFYRLLDEGFPEGLVMFDDNMIFAQNFYRVSDNDLFFPNTGVSSLGHSIPAAIGAGFKVDKPLFAILGDGGFQMCGMEVMTAVNYGISLNIVLINNQTLGLIRKNQHQLYGERLLGCDFQNPDFSLMAKSFGINYFKLETEQDCLDSFKRIDFYHGINLIELIIDQDAYPNYSSQR
jgi:acetolactate synthase I/II/III large subunit